MIDKIKESWKNATYADKIFIYCIVVMTLGFAFLDRMDGGTVALQVAVGIVCLGVLATCAYIQDIKTETKKLREAIKNKKETVK